jgi:hypothetical protein
MTMLFPQQLEDIAQDRERDWNKEREYQRLLAQLPREPARWRRWTGNSLVRIGTGLMRWGERMARREYQESVSAVG